MQAIQRAMGLGFRGYGWHTGQRGVVHAAPEGQREVQAVQGAVERGVVRGHAGVGRLDAHKLFPRLAAINTVSMTYHSVAQCCVMFLTASAAPSCRVKRLAWQLPMSTQHDCKDVMMHFWHCTVLHHAVDR